MSIPRKKGGTAAKVLSTALSAAMVVAFTPVVALGADHVDGEAESCGNDVASVTFGDKTTYYTALDSALEYVSKQSTSANAIATVKLLKGVTTSSEVVLDKSYVVFDGDGQILNGTAVTGGAALLVSAGNVTVKNLSIVGPNSQSHTIESDGRIWDDGEFGLKVYQANEVKISNVTASHANAGIQVNESAVAMEGLINVSGNEWGGVELCHGGSLDVTGATLYNDDETSKTPVVWNDDTKGTLVSSRYMGLYLEEVDDSKDHYFLSYHHVGTPTDLGSSKTLTTSHSVVKCYSFTVPDDGKDYTLGSAGGVGDNDPEAELYLVNDDESLTHAGYSDDEGGDLNFRFFNLKNGKTYRVYVNALGASSAGTVTVSLSEYNANDSSNYRISMEDDVFYYSGTPISLSATGAKVVEKKSGEPSAKFDLTLEMSNDDVTWEPVESKQADDVDASYRIVAAPKDGVTGKSLYMYFNLLDAKDLRSYVYTVKDLVKVSAANPASKDTVALTVKRRDGSAATLPGTAYTVEGWYSASYDSEAEEYEVGAKLASAPTAAGRYFAELVGANGYSGSVKVLFEATEKTIAVEPTAKTGLSYTGYSQYGLTGGSNYTVASTTGNSAYGTNAGNYTTIVVPAANCVWSDGTTAARTISWSIARAKVAVPTAKTGLKYTGSAQTGVNSASNVTLGGTYYATNVGSYTATASLPNTNTASNYQWADGTTAAKSISWSIAKGSLPVSVGSVFATAYVGTTYTGTYSYAGDGAVTATSSNPAVATVTASGGKITCVAKAAGTATITISAAGTANCLPASGTVVLTVKKPAAAPSGSFINTDGSFAGGSNGGVPGSASDAQQAAASYKVTTPAGSSTPTVTYMGGAKSGSASIPSTVKDQNGVTYRVTAVAKNAFKGTKVTKASLGSYVKTIGSSAFSGCTKLTSLTIGKSVTSVGTSAIKGCSKLKTVTVKSSKLTKTSIKNLVKGTKVTTIKCSGVSKEAKAKYAKWVKSYNKKASVK